MNGILTPKEAAAMLKVSEQTVKELLRQKKLAGFKVGTLWRIPDAALQEYINSQLPKPEPKKSAAEVAEELRQGMERRG